MKITRTKDTEILEGDALELAEFERNRGILNQQFLAPSATMPGVSTWPFRPSFLPGYIPPADPTWSFRVVDSSCPHQHVTWNPAYLCTCPMTCVCKGWTCGGVITFGSGSKVPVTDTFPLTPVK